MRTMIDILQNFRNGLEKPRDQVGCIYHSRYGEGRDEFDTLVDFLYKKDILQKSKDPRSIFQSMRQVSRSTGSAGGRLVFKDISIEAMQQKVDVFIDELRAKSRSSEHEKPVVGVTFYSKRTATQKGYYDGIFNAAEKKNVMDLIHGLQQAASKYGAPLPELEITLFLVPDWASQETFESPAYLEAKSKMLEEARSHYDHDVSIQDFLLEAEITEMEQAFLDQCDSMGSIADLMKSRVIINNKGRKCLQTDANVLWANHDFETLYKLTFMQNDDAFNASRCSDVYIAPHNKVIYIDADSEFPDLLSEELLAYCDKYQQDTYHKSKNCNGVYDFAFTRAMYLHQATYIVSIDDKNDPDKKFYFYPAKLTDPRYTLIPMVVPCQQETWRAGKGEDSDALKELKGQFVLGNGVRKPAFTINICGVDCSFHHFKSIVKAYTNCPKWHTLEGNYKNYDETYDQFEDAKYAHQLFVDRLDGDLCQKIMVGYYNAVQKAYVEQKEFMFNPLQELAHAFEEGNDASEKLCDYLFDCDVAALKNNPNRQALPHLSFFDVPILPSYASLNVDKFSQEKGDMHKLSEYVVGYSSMELDARLSSDRQLAQLSKTSIHSTDAFNSEEHSGTYRSSKP